jgi:hypothetical protein
MSYVDASAEASQPRAQLAAQPQPLHSHNRACAFVSIRFFSSPTVLGAMRLSLLLASVCCATKQLGESSPSRYRKRGGSQVRLLITNNAFRIVQSATEQSETEIFRGCGAAEAPPGFQAGWSDCIFFFPSICSFGLLIWGISVPYRSLAQMSCREGSVSIFLHSAF